MVGVVKGKVLKRVTPVGLSSAILVLLSPIGRIRSSMMEFPIDFAERLSFFRLKLPEFRFINDRPRTESVKNVNELSHS